MAYGVNAELKGGCKDVCHIINYAHENQTQIQADICYGDTVIRKMMVLNRITRRRITIASMFAIASSVLLSACTGGHGGGTSVSSDQGVDPVLLEIPIAYVTRPIPEDPIDYLEPNAFNPGARLIVRERSSLNADDDDITPQMATIVAAELNVATSELQFDIKDLDTSFDGTQLVFAARVVPEPVNANLELTTWNLWIYDFTTKQVRYLIPSLVKRNEGFAVGSAQDTAPQFLTDDRIVFTSTRQTTAQARQLNEGRAQIYSALDEDRNNPASILMVFDPQGGADEFRQLSFNQSHDFEPVALANGKILFSRWNNAPGRNHVSLFTINPSGRELSNHYGYHSTNTGTDDSAAFFTQPRELPNGSILAILKSRTSPSFGGRIIIIDGDDYADIDQPTWANRGLSGPGHRSLVDGNITTDGSLSRNGQYASAYPLFDGTNRILTSWSPCRVLDNNDNVVPCTIGPADGDPAPPLYGVWIYNADEETQKPVVTAREGVLIAEVVAAEPRSFPAIPAQPTIDLSRAESEGHLLIDSVYDFNGANNGRNNAVYLRVVQPVPIPTDDVFDVPNYAYGVNNAQSMREILGYFPIASDGSVSGVIPAEAPLMISVVDANARRISERHDFWLQAGRQETVHCVGCHTGNSELPHGRIDSKPTSSNPTPIAAATLFDIGIDPYGYTGIPPSSSAYLSEWTDIETGREIVVPNFDPSQPSRIVINYIDHIQPIWDRIGRPLRKDINDVDVDSCAGCHTTVNDTLVPPGQLDLTAQPSDINADHYRSYRELLSNDNQQWINAGGQLADRIRNCTSTDADGNILTQAITFTVGPTMSAASANASTRFFGCFENGACGRHADNNPPLPANCTDDGGTIAAPTMNTVDHTGLLTPVELRLISEWLDIGAQYYNNPFDSRLN